MNDLHHAYAILGLDPGASMEAISRRYKSLVLVWHPDRFPGTQGKQDAEHELKIINHARDVLKAHFTKGGHRESGFCECQSINDQQSFGAQQSTGGHGPSPRRSSSSRTAQPETGANRNRDEDSRRRSEQEAARKTQQEASPPEGQSVHNVFRKDRKIKYEPLRRKISLGCGATFVLLFFILMAFDCLAQPILQGQKSLHGSSDGTCPNQRFIAEWKSYQNNKEQVAYTLLRRQPTVGETNRWTPPFVSSTRGADSLSELAHHQFVVRAQEQKRQSDQVLISAKMDVERYQNAIEFCQKRLAELELILADPTISPHDRHFAVADQSTQLKFLQESRANLKYALHFWHELQG